MQVIVSSLYGILHSRATLDELRGDTMDDDDYDVIIVLAERLCSLNESPFASDLQTLNQIILDR